MIEFFVAGTPVTQGSKRAFVNKATGRAVVTETGGANHRSWREAVANEARAYAAGRPGYPITGQPVEVALTFGLQRPVSAPKKRRTWPIGARSGDLDKLARSILDSLTGVLIADDAQVVSLLATKDYGQPGVHVTVRLVVPDQLEAVS